MSNFDCTLIFPENGLSVKKNFHNNKSKLTTLHAMILG